VANTPNSPKPYEIRERTFLFALDVLKAYPEDSWRHPPSAIVWRQLIRAAGAVGANLEEAHAGSGSTDFGYRVKVSLREARESKYWLRLVEAAELRGAAKMKPLIQEASELVAILTTIVKKREANLARKKSGKK
jgi:four helix bundle protein